MVDYAVFSSNFAAIVAHNARNVSFTLAMNQFGKTLSRAPLLVKSKRTSILEQEI